jgi:hypothetical protein
VIIHKLFASKLFDCFKHLSSIELIFILNSFKFSFDDVKSAWGLRWRVDILKLIIPSEGLSGYGWTNLENIWVIIVVSPIDILYGGFNVSFIRGSIVIFLYSFNCLESDLIMGLELNNFDKKFKLLVATWK